MTEVFKHEPRGTYGIFYVEGNHDAEISVAHWGRASKNHRIEIEVSYAFGSMEASMSAECARELARRLIDAAYADDGIVNDAYCNVQGGNGMNWRTVISTPDSEPRLEVMNAPGGRTLLGLRAAGFEASVRMDTDTMRELRDALNERLEAAKAKEAA